MFLVNKHYLTMFLSYQLVQFLLLVTSLNGLDNFAPLGKQRLPEEFSIPSLMFSPGGVDFYQRHILPHKPLFVKAATRHWPIINGQWHNLSYVNEIFSHEKLPVIAEDGQTIDEEYFGKIIEFKMKINTVVPKKSKLLHGVYLPLLLQCNDLVKAVSGVRLRMNGEMEQSLQFSEKDILMAPFETPISVMLFGINGTLSGQSFKTVNTRSVDLNKFSDILDVPYQLLEILPGDLQYIPSNTWYHVTSADTLNFIQIEFDLFSYDFKEDLPYDQALKDYMNFLSKQPNTLNCSNTKTSMKDALTIDFSDKETIKHLRIPRKNKKPDDVTLASGFKMPVLGLGTAFLNESTYDAVKYALSIGYRMIDTAYGYPLSEINVGKAIHDGQIPREDVFIVTKLHPRFLGYQETLYAIDESLKNLNTTYIDLYLIHSVECDDLFLTCQEGEPHGTWKDSWRAMEYAMKEGKLRSLGVSNFYKSEIIDLLNWSVESVSVVQNWFDPFNQDTETRKICSKYNIRYMGYSTLGTRWKLLGLSYNPVMESDMITAIAGNYDYVISHVVLRWAIHMNVTVIPRSANRNHIAQNIRSLDISMHQSDIDSFNELDDWMNALSNVVDEKENEYK